MKLAVKDLSVDQREAYDAVIRWVAANPAPYAAGYRAEFTHGDDFDELDDDGDDGVVDGHYEGPPAKILTLGGFAGSGKSTLVSLVAEKVELPAFCAYTGKATSVLRRKLKVTGVHTVGTQLRRDGKPSLERRPFCGTIHSLIYRPCACREPETVDLQKPCSTKGCSKEMAWTADGAVCAAGHTSKFNAKQFDGLEPKRVFVYAEKDENGVCKICRDKGFIKRDLLDRKYNLIVLDEASMADDTILRDLRSYGVPILAVGDHGQLPPVGGNSTLMKEPNLRLEKIHRQAEGNPIIALSKMIRETGKLPDSLPGDAVTFEKLRFLDRFVEERYVDADAARLLQVGLICYTNRRRVGLNVAVRRALGHARQGRELPKKGEHVVCLRNMKADKGRPAVANGMRGVLITDAVPKPIFNAKGVQINESESQLVGSIEFPDDEIDALEYTMLRAQFGREKTFSTPEELAKETGFHSFTAAGNLFDFGYAMTCHKMQGSQVEDLAVLVERPGPVSDEDWRRWLYTAVTRSASKLTVLR